MRTTSTKTTATSKSCTLRTPSMLSRSTPSVRTMAVTTPAGRLVTTTRVESMSPTRALSPTCSRRSSRLTLLRARLTRYAFPILVGATPVLNFTTVHWRVLHLRCQSIRRRNCCSRYRQPPQRSQDTLEVNRWHCLARRSSKATIWVRSDLGQVG